MDKEILRLQGVYKGYQDISVLENCHLSFGHGLYGVLGENGAGKSTLIKMITATLPPDQGQIFYRRKDIWNLGEKYRKLIGYMPQDTVGYPKMRVYDFMEYMTVLKGIAMGKSEKRKLIMSLLEKVHLSDVCHRRYETLSGGMKRRVLLAQAMLGRPEILILDEPTAGLDPKERMSMKNEISEQALDKTVIVATHIISDVECAADQIIFMKKGEVLGCRTPAEWIAETENHVAEVLTTVKGLSKIQERFSVSGIHQQEKGILVRIISEHFEGLSDVRLTAPTLEDAYAYHVML